MCDVPKNIVKNIAKCLELSSSTQQFFTRPKKYSIFYFCYPCWLSTLWAAQADGLLAHCACCAGVLRAACRWCGEPGQRTTERNAANSNHRGCVPQSRPLPGRTTAGAQRSRGTGPLPTRCLHAGLPGCLVEDLIYIESLEIFSWLIVSSFFLSSGL